jgi:hypothetical protein
MDSCQLAVFVSTIACSIYKSVSTDDSKVIAAVLTQIGDTLATMLINAEVNNPKEDKGKKTTSGTVLPTL